MKNTGVLAVTEGIEWTEEEGADRRIILYNRRGQVKLMKFGRVPVKHFFERIEKQEK